MSTSAYIIDSYDYGDLNNLLLGLESLVTDIEMPLLIREEDVAKAVSLRDFVEAAEDGFRQYGMNLAQTQPRREVRIRNKDLLHADPRMVRIGQGLAFLEQSEIAVANHILSFPEVGNPPLRMLNIIIDAKDGKTIAAVQSLRLLAMRTGASGAVGAKFLSRKNSSVVGTIGTGRQGRHQLRFLLLVRPISKAYAYSLVPAETETFCREMSTELDIDVRPAESIEQVVRNSDIVVTTTQSTSPIIKAEWLKPGLHINIMGADDTPKIEVEGAALKKADKLVITAIDCFLAGQLRKPIEEGIISEKDVYGNIGEIIAGIKPGRQTDDEITIYHSPGTTLEDAAAAYKAYLRAKQLGLGINIPDPFMFG